MTLIKRKASKEHECEKCNGTIYRGDLYFEGPYRKFCYEHGQNMLKFSFVKLKHE